MKTLYTIGHSNHGMEHFLGLLRRQAIVTLVDVRSQPYSRWAPQFRKDRLADSLEQCGIAYAFFGRELGGRPQSKRYYDETGEVDYVRRAQAPDFRRGIEWLEEHAGNGRTAVMCAEEDPGRCHRRLLITPVLQEKGVVVMHIRGDGRLQSEEEFCVSSAQMALFE